MKEYIPPELRWVVWERDNFTCQNCGERKPLAVDHIIPESQGGATTLDNLQTLCKSCNSRKGARLPGAGVGAKKEPTAEELLWQRLVEVLPYLGTLYEIARHQHKIVRHNRKPFCANAIWYGESYGQGLKYRMSECVGHGARRTSLPDFVKTSEAYDVAYDKIYQALPDCRHEGECWG